MGHNNIIILVESLVGLILGICLIFGRMQVAKIFKDYAIKNTGCTDIQQKILFIIIWLIGIVFILGSIFQITKLILRR